MWFVILALGILFVQQAFASTARKVYPAAAANAARYDYR